MKPCSGELSGLDSYLKNTADSELRISTLTKQQEGLLLRSECKVDRQHHIDQFSLSEYSLVENICNDKIGPF